LESNVSEVSRDQECWLPVPAWEGFYEVSDLGRVRGVDRTVVAISKLGLPFDRRLPGQIIRSAPVGKYGHQAVGLYRDSAVSTLLVHRMVLLAFRGEPEPGQEGCHNNSQPTDNRLSNLRWDTHSNNLHDRWDLVEECPQEHKLSGPNLIPMTGTRRGQKCKACKRARDNGVKDVRAGRPFDFRTTADEHYHAIMNGLPSPRRGRRKE
jgi:hypothetical protein